MSGRDPAWGWDEKDKAWDIAYDKAMEHADAVCIAAGLKKDTPEWNKAWEAARKDYPMPSLI